MNVKEVILKRRSIRKYKKDKIADELIYDLLDCARLAPSACNSQPWRFKIVKDDGLKDSLAKLAFNQKHIRDAPVIILCCVDLKDYIKSSLIGAEELYKLDIVDKRVHNLLKRRTDSLKNIALKDIYSEVSFNVAIAVEHISLRAVELGLGTCWVRLASIKEIGELFNWDDNIQFVSMLTLGYPKGELESIKKLEVEDILL